MRRVDNINIFKDTENLVRSNKKILNAVQFSTDNQQLILEDADFRAPELNLAFNQKQCPDLLF